MTKRKRSSQKQSNFFKFYSIIFFLCIGIIGITTTLIRQNTAVPCGNSISCAGDLTGIYNLDRQLAVYHDKVIPIPHPIQVQPIPSTVLGDTTASNKRIEINLSKQRIYAFEGDRKIFDFLISTGLWNRTPTGSFTIWIKLRFTRMRGGNRNAGTYYDLPNVPYTMFFYNNQISKTAGYGIHGTYWHSNFGHPMSHGCINMRTEEVAQLYEWANPPTTGNVTHASAQNPGTPVIIYGVAPSH